MEIRNGKSSDGFQIAKDSSTEKLIVRLKSWYLEKEGEFKYFCVSSGSSLNDDVIRPRRHDEMGRDHK